MMSSVCGLDDFLGAFKLLDRSRSGDTGLLPGREDRDFSWLKNELIEEQLKEPGKRTPKHDHPGHERGRFLGTRIAVDMEMQMVKRMQILKQLLRLRRVRIRRNRADPAY
ncbi:hypothetical protein L596_009376 [Steinernema carpocapsae]|uniref:Uncharacterized protein n=1 Tax=Steinernema carpocapsae TaxID=34508 RepID=A0A4U5PFP5_STECR|nr:hypothetical protein L596_009376 [Steinernema carpocapsae]